MGVVPALLLIGAALLAYKSGAFAALGLPAPISSTNLAPGGLQPNVSMTAPQPVQPGGRYSAFGVGGGPSAPGGGGVSLLSGGLISGNVAAPGAAGVEAAVGNSLAASGQGFLAGGPIGAVVAGITSLLTGLQKGHQIRMQQATDENSAMNMGVQGYDQGLAQINAAFVARQISAVEAIQLVQVVMQNYWSEVTPHIQPGRNGCAGGTSCPPWPASGSGCAGSIGAACCVGCYALIGGHAPTNFPGYGVMFYGILGTIAVLQQGGGAVYYQEVFPSHYGGKQRNPYVLTWVQSSVA
jgi:gas vesicle protein